MQEECLKVLHEFKNKKSPGTYGFQAEFYTHFWKELHADMLHSFNYAFDSGKLYPKNAESKRSSQNRTKIPLYSTTSGPYHFSILIIKF